MQLLTGYESQRILHRDTAQKGPCLFPSLNFPKIPQSLRDFHMVEKTATGPPPSLPTGQKEDTGPQVVLQPIDSTTHKIQS